MKHSQVLYKWKERLLIRIFSPKHLPDLETPSHNV